MMTSNNDMIKLSVAPNDFVLDELLGKGSYGKVYKVITEENNPMVVKMISCLCTDGIANPSEIDIMSKLIHPNLTSSRGVKGIYANELRFLTEGNQPLTVTTVDKKNNMKSGKDENNSDSDIINNIDKDGSRNKSSSLQNYSDDFDIQDRNIAIFMDMACSTILQYVVEQRVNIVEKTRLIMDVCKGLEFLHSNGILHLDIKPDNILIFNENGRATAKLSDFGNSVYVNNNSICNGQRIINRELTTITYRAPESFNHPIIYGKHSDVWSLGIVILYTLVGAKVLFRDYKKTREEIYRVFCNKNKRIFLDDCLSSSLPSPYRFIYVNLLDKMLTINLHERISSNEILNEPVFSCLGNYRNNEGLRLCPTVLPVKNPSVLYYRGFDYLIRTCLSVDDSIETTFLACDLYQRIIHAIEIENDDMEYHWPNICISALTCFWIAHKMIETTQLKAADIVKIGNGVFDVNALLLIESRLIERLGGIIYRPNLYTSSQCYHKLLISFESLRNFFIYDKMNLDLWSETFLPECSNEQCRFDRYDRFSTFYIKTEYYRISSTPSDTDEQKDYVDLIYQQDKSVFYTQPEKSQTT